MALPGHSPPPPFPIAGSPPRLLTGHPDHHFQPTMYNHRPLIPPSPQPFPRFQSVTQTQMPHPTSIYDIKGPSLQHPSVQNPHKRPGSSMSLSSILDSEPGRHNREMPLFHGNNQNSIEQGYNHASVPGMSVGAIMSPPQQPTRGGLGDFSYKRSQTPDRLETFAGNRQRSASSSAPMPPYRPIYEPQDRYAKPPTPQFHPAAPLPGPPPSREEQDERLRRTSLSGILQRPNSQPQVSVLPPQFSRPYETMPPSRPNWYADPPPPMHEPPRSNGIMGTYDTKPPFRETPRSVANTHLSPSMPVTQPSSPEIRRPSNGMSNRGLANLLNGPASQGPEHNTASAQGMIRQASSQSHSDRSVFDERNRFRHFSPYTSNLDEQGRKNSEDITNKPITGLSFENKRRYSPVPRAVQGAQAQTPVPDDGPRGDQGKIFSGIGGGLGNSTTPVPTASSPFKKDDRTARSADPLKMGKTVTSIGKRSRKTQDEDSRTEADQEGRKNGTKSNKKAKHQSYKIGAEETNGTTQRRGTPVANGVASRLNATSTTGAAPSTRYDTQPIFKPRKTVKVTTLVSQILKKPRKHLGTYRYEPIVLVPESSASGETESDICIKPKLLPSFSEAEDLNATFTIHVSKTWLQDRERRIVCSTRNIWGSGVYTDDSDPLAAAMHMGWIKPAFANIDETLLQKIVHDQNPKVEISKELKPPSKPLELTKGRDLKITCVVMPLLERYEDTARFGLKSRAWPEVADGAPHDGVSFSILKVELVEIGAEERRMGRTGQSKRARLHAQLLQRERATRLEKERVERMMKRIKERADAQKHQQEQQRQLENKKSPVSTTKAPSPLSKEITMDDDIIQPPTAIKDGEEWIRQLATAAA